MKYLRYINDTIEYPYVLEKLRIDYPLISFPEILDNIDTAEFNVYTVTEVAEPTITRLQKCEEGTPILQDNVWIQTWNVIDKTANEVLEDNNNFMNYVVSMVQKRLDDFAKQRNYDGILSACTYKDSNVTKFAAEATHALNVRDSTWSTLYTILAEVQGGTRTPPVSYQEVEALLPILSWDGI